MEPNPGTDFRSKAHAWHLCVKQRLVPIAHNVNTAGYLALVFQSQIMYMLSSISVSIIMARICHPSGFHNIVRVWSMIPVYHMAFMIPVDRSPKLLNRIYDTMGSQTQMRGIRSRDLLGSLFMSDRMDFDNSRLTIEDDAEVTESISPLVAGTWSLT